MIDSSLGSGESAVQRARRHERWAADLLPDFAIGLGERTWTMLRLIYFTGLTQSQVADEMQLHEADVRSAVASGMQMLGGMITAR